MNISILIKNGNGFFCVLYIIFFFGILLINMYKFFFLIVIGEKDINFFFVFLNIFLLFV